MHLSFYTVISKDKKSDDSTYFKFLHSFFIKDKCSKKSFVHLSKRLFLCFPQDLTILSSQLTFKQDAGIKYDR